QLKTVFLLLIAKSQRAASGHADWFGYGLYTNAGVREVLGHALEGDFPAERFRVDQLNEHRSAPGIGIVHATVSCETTGQRLDQYSQCESFIARVKSTERQHRSRWILNEFSRVVGCVSTT